MGTTKRRSLLLVLPLLLISGVARASTIVETTVPFPFKVQNHAMPAGEYRIERDADNPAVLVIRGEKGTHATCIALASPASGQDPEKDKAVLVFTKHEQTYQLKDVWEGSGEGQEIVQR